MQSITSISGGKSSAWMALSYPTDLYIFACVLIEDAACAPKDHEAYSCDILPCSGGFPEWHIQDDVRNQLSSKWDLMIAHPPCTYLSISGMHWTTRGLRDIKLTDEALDFVRLLLEAPISRIALENPVSIISSRIRKPDQIIQPYDFGHDASKKTCLWLKGLRPLCHTQYYPPRIVNGKKRWGNQTDSGQNRLGPSENRAGIRSLTYPNIAKAMADQWGKGEYN